MVESTTDVLLSGHVIKLPSKYLCLYPQTSAVLRFCQCCGMIFLFAMNMYSID